MSDLINFYTTRNFVLIAVAVFFTITHAEFITVIYSYTTATKSYCCVRQIKVYWTQMDYDKIVGYVLSNCQISLAFRMLYNFF